MTRQIKMTGINRHGMDVSHSQIAGGMVRFLLSLVAFTTAVQAQQNPSISFISKEQVVEIGDTLKLRCITQYAKDYPVHWIKENNENRNNYLFISKGSTINVPNSRYSIAIEDAREHWSASRTYVLTIDKIQEIDSGRYSCQIITGSAAKETAETFVIVRIPPIISDNSTRSVITTIGTTVELFCYAAGYPHPVISWRREKNKLMPGIGAVYLGNKMVLRNVTKDDRGTYYCVADNGVQSGARRSVGVEIEFIPYVSIERPRYGQALQYDAILQCHVESFPSPSIEWYKDGVVLTDNQHYEISIYATSEEFSDTTIKVKRIEKKQYGNYVCKATNKLGSDYKTIELFETVNVICPPACDVFAGYSSGSEPGAVRSSVHYSSYALLTILILMMQQLP